MLHCSPESRDTGLAVQILRFVLKEHKAIPMTTDDIEIVSISKENGRCGHLLFVWQREVSRAFDR